MESSKIVASAEKKLPPNAGKGREKGVPNKATRAFRETVTKLLEDNSENISLWLESVAKDSPKDAIDLICKLAEYSAPKLARVEQQTEIKMAPSFNLHVSGNGGSRT